MQQTNDQLPMYGQPGITRSEELRKADDEFIKQTTAPVGTREVASKVLHSQGNAYFNRGLVELAMRRYNQAWLLNPNNYQPYWGFGRVMLQRGQFDEGIAYFEKATRLCDDDYQKVALLSDFGAAYGIKANKTNNPAERTRLYGLAYEQYKRSTGMDPKYQRSWQNWASTLYQEGNYSETWKTIREGQVKADAQFSPQFLRELEQKMPEPK
ncbi:MAG TPA: hypothetical protein VJO54_15240 [Burkholderiales bacterium]|nr:hypothetical protein [Burkholderiales bacterium]